MDRRTDRPFYGDACTYQVSLAYSDTDKALKARLGSPTLVGAGCRCLAGAGRCWSVPAAGAGGRSWWPELGWNLPVLAGATSAAGPGNRDPS